MQGDYDGGSRPEKRCNACLERGDRLLWIKQRIRGGCIRSIQHSVLTTDGAGGESPAPFQLYSLFGAGFHTRVPKLRAA